MRQPILILVIDSDFDTVEVLRDRLNDLGFHVLTADSGDQGLAFIREQASSGCPITGILLNVHMPGFDGMAVLARLQNQHPEIPVIMMSSLPNGGRLEEALRQGARDLIMKPFDNEVLREKCLRHFPSPFRS
jgi:CheY-like chemotaxis protein